MNHKSDTSGLRTIGPPGKTPGAVITIYPRDVIVGPRQRELSPERVRELAMSIRQSGQLQPIGVREEKNNPDRPLEKTYTLIFGAHRLAAIVWLEEQRLEPGATV